MTEEVAKVAPEIKARSIDEDDASMFSNHSEEKCSYRYPTILVSVFIHYSDLFLIRRSDCFLPKLPS